MATAPRIELGLVAALLVPRPAAALVGDRYEAFGLDGSLRLVMLATDNYDAPPIFGPGNRADGLSQSILRLVAGGVPVEWLSYEAHLVQTTTLEAFSGLASLAGDSAGSTASLLGGTGTPGQYRLVPAQLAFGEQRTSDVHAQLLLDRFSLKLTTDVADITIGRQAITFGTAYFWNPLDVFFAFGSTQFDRDYKPGVDAVRVDVPFGDFSGATLVAAFGDAGAEDVWRETALVVRAFTNQWDWDFIIQGGELRGGAQAGAAFVGEAFTLEVRGEVAYFWASEGEPIDDHLSAVLGVGRRFESTLYLQAEHLFNGGSADSLLDSFGRVAGGWIQQASHNVTGVTASYEILPVLLGSVALLFEWDNRSMLLQPGLAYSAADEVDLVAGALLAFGERPEGYLLRSEFGTYPSVFYLESKIYF